MIYINGTKVSVEHFLAGEQRLKDIEIPNHIEDVVIRWLYDNDEECMTLWYIVNHIKDNFIGKRIHLEMPYVPNARMDRVYDKTTVFTEKYFARFINSMGFASVKGVNIHSNVTLGNIDKIDVLSNNSFTEGLVDLIHRNLGYERSGKIIYFPDEGALKNFGKLECLKGYRKIFGSKVRNFDTGEIVGLTIHNEDGSEVENLEGKTVLMIDDIISYGGSLAYSADALKKCGAGDIYAYATHTENSVLDEEKGTLLKRFKNGTVKKVFTTNSIYRGESEFIEVIRHF